MFTTDEQTEERVDSYVDGLQHERAGYEARQAAAKVVKDAETVALMDTRLAAVDTELARFKNGPEKKPEKKDDAKSE